MRKDHEPPSDEVGSHSGGDGQPPDQPEILEPPPYNPDPDLITLLEREAKPGEVRVWHPDQTD